VKPNKLKRSKFLNLEKGWVEKTWIKVSTQRNQKFQSRKDNQLLRDQKKWKGLKAIVLSRVVQPRNLLEVEMDPIQVTKFLAITEKARKVTVEAV